MSFLALSMDLLTHHFGKLEVSAQPGQSVGSPGEDTRGWMP